MLFEYNYTYGPFEIHHIVKPAYHHELQTTPPTFWNRRSTNSINKSISYKCFDNSRKNFKLKKP